VKVRYFAWLRERVGCAEEEIALPPHVDTVGDLVGWLKARGPEFEGAFENVGVVRAALDHTHASLDTPLGRAREVAFFPPMTGG
jgi:sulfur-carrier protein